MAGPGRGPIHGDLLPILYVMFDVDDARITRGPAQGMAGPGRGPIHGDLLPILYVMFDVDDARIT